MTNMRKVKGEAPPAVLEAAYYTRDKEQLLELASRHVIAYGTQ